MTLAFSMTLSSGKFGIHLKLKETPVHLVNCQNRTDPFTKGLTEDSFSLDTYSFNTLNDYQSTICHTDVGRRTDPFTFCFLLKGLSRHADHLFVRQLHVQGVKSGFCTNPFVCNALLNVYAKGVKDLGSAYKVFDEIPERERTSMVCCWTGVIAGCAQMGENERALQIFLKMIIQQLRPDSDTMVSVLSACATLRDESIDRWINLFELVIRDSGHGSVANDQVNVVLTYLYGKEVGDIGKSRAAFDEIGRRSVVTWNAIINVYVQNGCDSEASSLFQSMMNYSHVQPNHVTMVSILCSGRRHQSWYMGSWIHIGHSENGCSVNKQLIVSKDVVSVNAL